MTDDPPEATSPDPPPGWLADRRTRRVVAVTSALAPFACGLVAASPIRSGIKGLALILLLVSFALVVTRIQGRTLSAALTWKHWLDGREHSTVEVVLARAYQPVLWLVCLAA